MDSIISYYFDQEDNIDELLEEIKFYPFEEKNFESQVYTNKSELKIITSGFYISIIKDEQYFVYYKILEITRKILVILHEITHFIKRILFLITNGQIWGETIESDKDDPNIIEVGRYFDSVSFWWENAFSKRSSKSSIKKTKKQLKSKKFWLLKSQ